jgi:serine/threonine protein kinase
MSPECQLSAPASQTRYASAPNDVWGLGVILVNLVCGRNPWKRASVDDATYRAFLKDPHFLSSILPISSELESILRLIFESNPAKRISLAELRERILACGSFTSQPRLPTPPPMDYEQVMYQPVPVVFAAPYENVYAQQFTPPTSPPVEASNYSSPDVSNSGSDNDSGSSFSDSSSVSSMSDFEVPQTPSHPDCTYSIPPAQHFYYTPPHPGDWKQQMGLQQPSVACY